MDGAPGQSTARARWRLTPLDLVDVLVYIVVLNLAIQFVPSVLSESFLLSLLTAVLLKVVLELVLRVKGTIVRRIRSASTTPRRVLAIATLVLVLPASKLLVLELVALVFGDAVQLGGFFAVTGLIIVLMLSRAGVRRLFTTKPSAERAQTHLQGGQEGALAHVRRDDNTEESNTEESKG